MDWMMPVNEMLKDDITKINYKLMPPNFKGDIRAIRVMQDSLTRLIDVIGEQSASAQGLNRIITTADKLRNSPTHILYLLKDARAKGGKGDVIGLLKIGQKHLFLFNENDKVCEVEPLCVLDFFVLKDRQRAGYGKILFDHMLQDMQTSAKKLAIDGPSPKMEQFLRKNYGVDILMRQNNNFAVSPEFFKLVPVISSKSGRCTPVESPAVGRFAALKPQSAIATIIHGSSSCYDDSNHWSHKRAIFKMALPFNRTFFSNFKREEMAEARHKTEEGSPFEPTAPPAPEPEPKAEPEPVVVAEAVANNTKSPERPSTLSVEPVAETGVVIPAISPAGSTISRRDSQLTEQGFFDVKFYHNKLW